MVSVLEDVDFERLKQRIEEEKAKRPSPGHGLSLTHPRLDGAFQSLGAFFMTRDYEMVRTHVSSQLDARKDVSIHERCAMVFSEAYILGTISDDLQEQIEADSLLSTAYCAYARAAGGSASFFEAHRFMQLAQLCGGDVAEHWYQSTQDKVNFEYRRCTLFAYLTQGGKQAISN